MPSSEEKFRSLVKKLIFNKKEEHLCLRKMFWKLKVHMFVRQMLELYDEPRPHFNTVSTFVRILEDKGFVGHRSVGKSFEYYALVSRDEYKKKTLKGVVSKYFNNSYLGVVSSLVKEEEISLDELKELIREVENANK